MVEELDASAVRWECPEEWIEAASTAELKPSEGIVGQPRAVGALEFGLSIDSLGFNVFVTGLTGTGKMTAIEMHLRPLASAGPPPDDLLYTYNFEEAERPSLLRLRAGGGAVLRDRTERLLAQLRENLPGVFEGEQFQHRLDLAIGDVRSRQQDLIRDFEKRVREAGFSLVQVQVGSVTRPELLPVVDSRPVTLEKVQGMAEEGTVAADRLKEIEKSHAALTEDLQRTFQQVMALREEMLQRAEGLRRRTVAPLLERALSEIAQAVGDPRVQTFLEAVGQDVLENLDLFAGGSQGGDDGSALDRYRVNVMVDNAGMAGRPIIIETDPSFANVFGTVEARLRGEADATTDHTRIRAGSLLRANGGFLVMNAFEAVSEPGVWRGLKRALRHRRVRVRAPETLLALSGQSLRPDPVELDVKVVLVGDREIFQALLEADEDFRKIFKVLADFDSDVPNTPERVADFAGVMSRIVRDEDLLPVDRDGIRALAEEGVRLAGSRRRITARFSDVADILREASFLARQAGDAAVTAGTVRAAVLARRQRHDLPEERLRRMVVEGVLQVATEGAEVGQVNGLAVYDLGYHAFGVPGRVTARVALGREGVINVEREARLSGRIHDKGVLILTGFLRSLFGGEVPLSMSASVAFEQSYGGIDGDSASSTEVYAILSALSGVPIRQDLAVTGAVDQLGRVEAIGGVSEKVEGFFRLCRERGLTGTQGVVIPASNAADLQLDEEVRDAIGSGRFHVYTVATVEEGIGLLTGREAGTRGADGGFPPDTVLGSCEARVRAMAEELKRYREP